MEFMTLICDVCKERPIVDTKKIKGEWKGICRECGGETNGRRNEVVALGNNSNSNDNSNHLSN